MIIASLALSTMVSQPESFSTWLSLRRGIVCIGA